jgi:hypothetical protein
MSRRAFSLCFVTASMRKAVAFSQSFLSQYKACLITAAAIRAGGAQKIPGRLLCAYYDLGGEGVAYHDSDPQNHGSGELNPGRWELPQRISYARGGGYFLHEVQPEAGSN